MPTPFANVFAVNKDTGALGLSTDEPLPQLDPALDPQFQLVLKKMSKKDGTTKLKALQEFRQLLETSDAEAVGLVTGLWCRVYVGLLAGGEGRVREAAHRAHEVVCSRAARSLAPHVRVLAAPWLAAVHDPHGPAAQAAKDSLFAAFPDERRRAELAARCRRQLLKQALDSLVAESKDERLISCALRAAASAIEQETTTVDEEVVSLLKKLLENEQFWKLSKLDASEGEKLGWASLLAASCRDPWRNETAMDGTKALKRILPVMWNSDSAAASLWDAILLLLPDHGQTVNLRKDLIEPLIKQLNDPGPGVVTRLCPALLPLLSRLPQDIASETGPILLDSCLECMKRSYVLHSRTEISAVAAAYMDVSQWCGQINAPANCLQAVLCGESIPGKPSQKAFITELGRLLRRWRGENAKQVWDSLTDVSCNTKIMDARPQLAESIVMLARPIPNEVRSSNRVTFGGDTPEISPQRKETSTPEDKWYTDNIQKLISNIFNSWLNNCDHVQTVAALLILLREIGIKKISPSNTPLNIYTTSISPVLHNLTFDSKDLPLLIELALLLLTVADNKEEKRSALDLLPWEAVPHAVKLAQHEPYSRDLAISDWLRSSERVRELYINLVRLAIDDELTEAPKDVELLVRALKTDMCDCIEKVVEILCTALDKGKYDSALCAVAASACRHDPIKLAPRLLSLSCSSQVREKIGDQLAYDIDLAWKDAVVEQPKELLNEMVQALRKSCKYSCDQNVVLAAVRLIISCENPIDVLASVYPNEIELEIENCVAFALYIRGYDRCNCEQPKELPNNEELTKYLGWKRLVASTLVRLLSPMDDDNYDEDLEDFDFEEHSKEIDSLVVQALKTYGSVTNYCNLYTHLENSDVLQVWVTDVKKMCERLLELRKIDENIWWEKAPNENKTTANCTWAASTIQLFLEQILPGSKRALSLKSPHSGHIAQISASFGLLDPRCVPSTSNFETETSFVIPKLTVSAADDKNALETAVAEAEHTIRRCTYEPNVNSKITDACWLMETVLRKLPTDAMMDLATTHLAEWSKLIGSNIKDVCLLAAYCQLAATHYGVIKDERAVEYEQLFASDIRRAIELSFAALIGLGIKRNPAAWPLCLSMRKAMPLILKGTDALWKLTLKGLLESCCIPVQLCAHAFLRRLCDSAAIESGKCPNYFATELSRLQDIKSDNTNILLGYVLAWDSAAILHAAWEQPSANKFLQSILPYIPNETKDEWFSFEVDFEERNTKKLFSRVCCVAFSRWLCEAGAACRSWWNESGLSASDKQRAERISARYVTKRAVRSQLVNERLPDGVKCATAGGRHIQAECRVEDARIELTIELGESWPLGHEAPKVEGRPAPSRERLMQLTLAAAAGAPIHRILKLWKDAVDKKYEGLDECHICFSLLHPATAQLPKLKCHTCRKIFHSACLYRWFNTSNKSTCPICRELF